MKCIVSAMFTYTVEWSGGRGPHSTVMCGGRGPHSTVMCGGRGHFEGLRER